MNSFYLKFLFILLNSHVLRKVSIIPSIITLIVYLFIFFKNRSKANYIKIDNIFICMIIYLIFNIYLTVITYITCSCESIELGIIRAFYVFPIFFSAIIVGIYGDQIKAYFKIYIYIIFISALILIYQFLFGAIEWFGPLFFRANLPRYFTILGALPTYGVASGLAIVLLGAIDESKIKLFSIYLILIIGMVLSLQKASIPNFIIASAIFFYSIYGKKILSIASITKVLLILIIFGFLFLNYFSGYISVMAKFLNIDVGDNVGWVGYDMQSQILGRLLNIFGEGLSAYQIIFGSGFQGMAGVLGFHGVTPHNGFADYFVSGGIIYLILYISILYCTAHKIIKCKKKLGKRNFISIIGFLMIFIINIPFYSGIMINPSLSSIFWIIVAYTSMMEKDGISKNFSR